MPPAPSYRIEFCGTRRKILKSAQCSIWLVVGTSKMNQIGDQAAELNPAADEQPTNEPRNPLDEWTATVMRNMKRMLTDEAYRLSIAKYLS